MKQSVVLLLPFLGPSITAHGVVVFRFDNLNALIPDGRGSGLVNRQTLTPDQISGSISDIVVRLELSGFGPSGAFNGDLFVTLQHESGFAVLLNRPGKTLGSDWGYGDNGLAVAFDDSGSAPDIHTYQLAVGVPAGPLTGTWSTDGRTADPSSVTADSPRSSSLNSFLGVEASGHWTIFLADLEFGGQARLDSWQLDLTTIPIPEPGAWWLVSGLGLAGYAFMRRRL